MSIHKQIMRAIMRQDMKFVVLHLSEVVWVHALTPNCSRAQKIAASSPDLRVYDIENGTFVDSNIPKDICLIMNSLDSFCMSLGLLIHTNFIIAHYQNQTTNH